MLRPTLFACLLMLMGAVSLEAQQRTDEIPTGEELLELFELTVEHHLAPATLHQLVHETVLASTPIAELEATELPSRIGNATREELATLLNDTLSSSNAQIGDFLQWFAQRGINLTPSKAQRVNEQLEANRYVGIGIQLASEPDVVARITKVFPGGPASTAGVQDGDAIIQVDSNPTKGTTLVQVVDWLRGPDGSEVEMAVMRDGRKTEFRMTRGVVPIASIEPAVTSESGETVGVEVIRIAASTVHELRRVAAQLPEAVSTVVLDLRETQFTRNDHNAVLLANALVDEQDIGFTESVGSVAKTLRSEPGELFQGRKVVCLVSSQTGGLVGWIARTVAAGGNGEMKGEPMDSPAIFVRSFPTRSEQWSVQLPVGIVYRQGDSKLTELAARSAVARARIRPPQNFQSAPRNEPNHTGSSPTSVDSDGDSEQSLQAFVDRLEGERDVS